MVERGPQVLLTHISPSVSPLRSDFSPTSRATLIFHKPQAEGATRAQTIHITLMSTEEIPSVLDREFDSPSVPLPHFLNIAHSFLHSPDEAFAAKYMPDLGREIKEFQVFHWKLSGWKGFEKKLTSSEFDCGGHKWYILPGCCRDSRSRIPCFGSTLVFPRGNSDPPRNGVVSVYLHCTGSKEKDWHVYAQFALAISNPRDPSVHLSAVRNSQLSSIFLDGLP